MEFTGTLFLIGLGVFIGVVSIILLSKNNQGTIGAARAWIINAFNWIKSKFSKKN